MMTNPPQPTFTLAQLFWVVTLIAALIGTGVVTVQEESIPVVITVFSISLVAQVAFVLMESTQEVRRAFAIGFVAALFPLCVVAMTRGIEAFVLASLGSRAPNLMLPYFETTFGATLVAIVIAVIAGLFVASARLLQRRRVGLVATAVFLILIWMFFWDCAVHFRGDVWGKDHSVQAGKAPHNAYFCSPSVFEYVSTSERLFWVAPVGAYDRLHLCQEPGAAPAVGRLTPG